MRNTEKILVTFLSLLIILLIFAGVLQLLDSLSMLERNLEASMDLSNPASSYCISHGGQLDIRTMEDGSQIGYCLFPNGNECEEWAYYRFECSSV